MEEVTAGVHWDGQDPMGGTGYPRKRGENGWWCVGGRDGMERSCRREEGLARTFTWTFVHQPRTESRASTQMQGGGVSPSHLREVSVLNPIPQPRDPHVMIPGPS